MNYRTLIATAFAVGILFAIAANAQTVAADGGTEAVLEAQNAEPAPASPKFKDASKVLKEEMKKKGFKEGWDEKKGRFLVVADADFQSEDPAKDKNFFTLREMAAKRAIMLAKSQIAEFVNSEMEASEMLDIGGTDVNKELGADAERIKGELAELEKQVAEAKKHQAENPAAPPAQQPPQTENPDTPPVQQPPHTENPAVPPAQLDELNAKLDAKKKEMDDLIAKAEELKNKVKTSQTSTIAVQAHLPIFGATVIMQSESWNEANGKYKVAILVCWSKALEETARAIVTGGDCKSKPGAKSIGDWLDGQNIATMVGPRQFIDDKGDRWFLGITARQYNDDMNSSARMRYKGLAQSFAQQMAVFSVFADVESTKTAAQELEITADKNDDYAKEEYAVAEDFAQKVSQTLEKRTIRGMQKLAEEEVTHPVTGQDILVCVYGLNAANATAALEIERRNIATLIEANRHETVEKGRKAANEAAIEASKNRADDFAAGQADQNNAIREELKSRKGSQNNVYNGPVNKDAAPKGKSTTFSGMGDADVSDDF